MQYTKFSVFDSKAEAFILPFYAPNTATGLRMFERACNEVGAGFNVNAGDYTLFELATWESDTAEETAHKAPINHGLAITFVHSELPTRTEIALKEVTSS